MMFGWAGQFLRVCLSTGEITVADLPHRWRENYLGGRGLGVRILWEEMPPTCDPRSEDNLLVLATGPLTGSGAPMSGRFSASCKSPLTGTVFDSSCGGDAGITLKSCGLDAVILRGRAAAPVYLVFDQQGAVLKDARWLWGKDIPSTKAALTQREGGNTSIITVGPAGELGVRYACCENNGRFFGRGGLGAVMGAKKLKAIVVKKGHTATSIADPDRFRFIAYEMRKWLDANPITSRGLPRFGTAVLLNLMNETGLLPHRNFRFAGSSLAHRLSGEEVTRHLLVTQRACPHCPVACGRNTTTGSESGEGPEFESLWALGVNLDVFDLKTVAEAHYACNRLGLDTISTGGTLACAAEIAEAAGRATLLPFGEGPRLKHAIEQIGLRRGMGDSLAEGAQRFAASHHSPETAMVVKGLELPAYDPRGAQGQALAYATSNRGGCHLRAYMIGPEILGIPKMINRFESAGKGGLVIYQQNLNTALDSMVMCRFSSFVLGDDYYARLLSAVTGIDYEPQDLHIIGERIWNLERLYNVREGLGPDDDTLPGRFLKEPLRDAVVNLRPMLDEYRRFRGWTAAGVPTRRKIARLQLQSPDEIRYDVEASESEPASSSSQ